MHRRLLGIAIAWSFGSIVAQVAQVAASPVGKLRVRNVHAAIDCGDVVNTDSTAARVRHLPIENQDLSRA